MTLQYSARSTTVFLKSKASADDLRRALPLVGVAHAFRRESDGNSQWS
jgi:hypothetical protein